MQQADQSVLVQKLRVTTVETLKQAKELGSKGSNMFGVVCCGIYMCTSVMNSVILKWWVKEALKVKPIYDSHHDWPL